jgi:hypothetical protein
MVLVVAFIFTGCQREYKEKAEAVDILDSGPNIKMTSVAPDYVVSSLIV